MNRIQPYLLFLIFLLTCIHPNLAFENEGNNQPQDKIIGNQQRNLVAPKPRRNDLKSLSDIYERLNQLEAILLQKKSEIEQRFRSHAHWQMAGPERHAHIQTDLCKITSFGITNKRIFYNNGYYEKVVFCDNYNRIIQSNQFSSLLIPLWILQPIALRDNNGRMFVQLSPYFVGYAYKRDDLEYWRWVDAGITRFNTN